ncbi:hypothetical protein EDC04DRAFT_2729947 [Pisolithus marmoratus]|nr:hypothetical protein EDC04DRAFT_2729947 [Pisolithus marmoratus]
MDSTHHGGYDPWHISLNTHCNGCLNNAVDSVKERLLRWLSGYLGTLVATPMALVLRCARTSIKE